jgi:hypothetical protein
LLQMGKERQLFWESPFFIEVYLILMKPLFSDFFGIQYLICFHLSTFQRIDPRLANCRFIHWHWIQLIVIAP